jgi:hypothetical protein
MSELLVQNTVKLATWDQAISEDPALPTIILDPIKVQGIDEIRILVATNIAGVDAEIQVFEGFEMIQPPNTISPTGVNWGNTYEFVVSAAAGVSPGFGLPSAVKAEIFSYKVTGECTGITAAWRGPVVGPPGPPFVFEVAVYAVPGK